MNNRVLCLLSGGIDSSVMLRRLKSTGHEVEAIFFDIKQSAVQWERAAAQQICGEAKVDLVEVSLRDWRERFPRQVEMLVVPRNLLFALAAVPYARSLSCDRIALGSTADDLTVADSNTNAISAFNALLTQIRQPMRLFSPWLEPSGENWDKVTIMEWAHRVIGPAFIARTRSCYSSSPEPCTSCRGCRNRRAALDQAALRSEDRAGRAE